MSQFLALPLLLAAQVTCTPTAITYQEARTLALQAGHTQAYDWVELDAEDGMDPERKDVYSFRVFGTNQAPGQPEETLSSNRIGWFDVNRNTAALTDPVLDNAPIRILRLKQEQRRLRAKHCQAEALDR